MCFDKLLGKNTSLLRRIVSSGDLERRSYKAMAAGSIPAGPILKRNENDLLCCVRNTIFRTCLLASPNLILLASC